MLSESFPEALRKLSRGSPEAHRNPRELSGALRSPRELSGALRSPRELSGALGSSPSRAS
eukprot:13185801-Alexandrium_andersonii.AAC.1